VSAVGLLLPGWASPREAAPMTLLVGASWNERGLGWLGLFVAHRCRGLLPLAGRRVGSCATEGVIA